MKLGEEAELAEQTTELAAIKSEGKDQNNPNSTWELLNKLDVPIRESHRGQTLRALLKVRGMNMIRDPMAVFFQVIMPVVFAALGIWLGTLATERTVEEKRSFSFGQFPR